MKVKIKEIKKLCLDILIKKGLSKKEAQDIFQEYLNSELMGITCHGFQAFSKFGAKLVESKGKAKIEKEGNSFLYIDGKKNLGQIVCNQYVPKLIKKARKNDIAMMGIHNMHSYLRPGTYARMAAENDLVGFVYNYGGWKRIAPYGSIDPFFGTNPIAIGVPGKDFPIVVDMATSKKAMMKVRMAAKLNKKLPEGMAIDRDGNQPLTPRKLWTEHYYLLGSIKDHI